MTEYTFREVDVFCTDGFDGNPLGVVHDADSLSGDDMQRIANWTNFSETTFLLAPTESQADYQVRIFTPHEELPFAGHPTVGSAHAWSEAGGTPQTSGEIVQQCGIGLVVLRTVADRLAFESPPLIRSGTANEQDRQRALMTLGLKESDVVAVEWVDNGPRWIGVELAEGVDIGDLKPVASDDDEVDIAAFKLAVFSTSAPEGVDLEVRCFFGSGTLREDPVTGSANASIARYLQATGRINFPYVASQGTYMGRNGRVYVSEEGDRSLWVGGYAQTLVTGTLTT